MMNNANASCQRLKVKPLTGISLRPDRSPRLARTRRQLGMGVTPQDAPHVRRVQSPTSVETVGVKDDESSGRPNDGQGHLASMSIGNRQVRHSNACAQRGQSPCPASRHAPRDEFQRPVANLRIGQIEEGFQRVDPIVVDTSDWFAVRKVEGQVRCLTHPGLGAEIEVSYAANTLIEQKTPYRVKFLG